MSRNDFEEALTALGWDVDTFPNLSKAFSLSSTRIAAARKQLETSIVGTPELDVIAFGSLARFEMTDESDLDYLVVVYALDAEPGTSRKALASADALRGSLGEQGKEIRSPGSTGVFGKMVSALDLVEVIGLEHDTNHSHTRRILFLEESVSLYKPEKHGHLLESIVRRYVEAKPLGKTKVPRFLLNDLARYWRTLTIDYQAKMVDNSLSLRYLKLIVSRKFTYVASILPLLLLAFDEEVGPADIDGAHLIGKLKETFSMPPVIRYLRACESLIAKAKSPELERQLLHVLKTVETFNGLLGDGDWRKAVDLESKFEPGVLRPEILEAKKLGQQLEKDLESIFFSEPLLPLTKKYLIF